MRLLGLPLPGILLAPAAAQVVLYDFIGPNAGNNFGNFVTGVGDLNGDGHDDFGIVAPAPLDWTDGFISIYSGATGAPLLTWTGPYAGGGPLLVVMPAGDVNGDGFADLLVQNEIRAAPAWNLLWAIPGPSLFFLASAPDVNADGYDDILWGNPSWPIPGIATNGQGNVVSGLDGALLYTYAGANNGDRFGFPAGLGDIDGDGHGDFAFGASQTEVGCGAGYVRVYSGGTGTELYALTGPGGVSFGSRIANAGDVNGDGVADLVVGAPNLCSFMVGYYGKAFVFSMADGSILHEKEGPPVFNAVYGRAVAGPGDVDGDGFADFLVAAPFGCMVFLYSGADGSTLAFPNSPSMCPGWSVAGAGDVNADGFPDYLAGDPAYSPSVPTAFEGRVRVYSGAPPGVTSFGSGCPGSGGVVPRIGATGTPALGAPFKVNLSRAPVAQPALLLLGLSASNWYGLPLPLDLAFLGMPGCELRVSPDFVFSVATQGSVANAAHASLPFAIPLVPSLAGISVYAQWYVVDPGPALLPGALTRGLTITFQ